MAGWWIIKYPSLRHLGHITSISLWSVTFDKIICHQVTSEVTECSKPTSICYILNTFWLILPFFIILKGVMLDRRPLLFGVFFSSLSLSYYWTNMLNVWILLKLVRFCTSSISLSKQMTVNVQTHLYIQQTCRYISCSWRWPPLGICGCMVQLFLDISQDLPASHSCFYVRCGSWAEPPSLCA